MSRLGRRASLLASVLLLVIVTGAMAAEGPPAPKPKTPVEAAKTVETTPTVALTDERLQELAKTTGLTSDVLRTTLEYIHKYKPRLARDLDTMLRADPQQYKNQISNMSYYARELAQSKRADPVRGARREQTLELEALSERLCDRYKEVSEAEKPQVEVELTNVLNKLFDLRLEEERYQLEQLRKQVEQATARINERIRNKDRIVDRQMTTLLGVNEALTW